MGEKRADIKKRLALLLHHVDRLPGQGIDVVTAFENWQLDTGITPDGRSEW